MTVGEWLRPTLDALERRPYKLFPVVRFDSPITVSFSPQATSILLNIAGLFWWLLIPLLVELANFLPLLRRQTFHPLVVGVLSYARRHARHKVFRLWQKLAIKNFGDLVEAVPLHVIGAIH